MIDPARARGCLVGLAVGDALGQPTEGLTPETVRTRHGRIDDLFDPAAAVSDDTEYALFSAQVIIDHRGAPSAADFAGAWRERIVPQTGPFKGAGFSEMAAIDNLRRGLEPPASGRHYHAWSDGLAMRVAPHAVAHAGRPAAAAALARVDGSVSHAGEGIHAGAAVAASLAAALAAPGAAALDAVLDEALAHVPTDSWTARALREGLAIGRAHDDPFAAMDALHEALAVPDFPWMDLAPEAVGLAWGLLAAGRGSFEATVLAATNLGRDADTVAAIAGSVLGALHGIDVVPERWHGVLRPATGRCLRCVTGMELLAVADALVDVHRALADDEPDAESR